MKKQKPHSRGVDDAAYVCCGGFGGKRTLSSRGDEPLWQHMNVAWASNDGGVVFAWKTSGETYVRLYNARHQVYICSYFDKPGA
jgi:hypothetical protein